MNAYEHVYVVANAIYAMQSAVFVCNNPPDIFVKLFFILLRECHSALFGVDYNMGELNYVAHGVKFIYRYNVFDVFLLFVFYIPTKRVAYCGVS